MDDRAAARLKMLAAALLFSTGGAAIKACSFTGWQVAGLRSGIAAVTLLVLVPAARRRWTRGQALVGLAYAATLILYVLANKLTTAANAIFLQSTAPLYMLLLSPLWLKEAVRRHDLFFMLALGVGMGLFFAGSEPARSTATNPLLGNILAAISAVTWALTVAGLRWIARTEGAEGGTPAGTAAGATVLGNLFVFVACLPLMFPMGEAGVVDWALVTYLGVFQIGLAYVFMTGGMRRIPALEGALLLLVEPVLNTVWAWLFHDEVPGFWARIGALLILAATAVHALRSERRTLPTAVP